MMWKNVEAHGLEIGECSSQGLNTFSDAPFTVQAMEMNAGMQQPQQLQYMQQQQSSAPHHDNPFDQAGYQVSFFPRRMTFYRYMIIYTRISDHGVFLGVGSCFLCAHIIRYQMGFCAKP